MIIALLNQIIIHFFFNNVCKYCISIALKYYILRNIKQKYILFLFVFRPF